MQPVEATRPACTWRPGRARPPEEVDEQIDPATSVAYVWAGRRGRSHRHRRRPHPRAGAGDHHLPARGREMARFDHSARSTCRSRYEQPGDTRDAFGPPRRRLRSPRPRTSRPQPADVARWVATSSCPVQRLYCRSGDMTCRVQLMSPERRSLRKVHPGSGSPGSRRGPTPAAHRSCQADLSGSQPARTRAFCLRRSAGSNRRRRATPIRPPRPRPSAGTRGRSATARTGDPVPPADAGVPEKTHQQPLGGGVARSARPPATGRRGRPVPAEVAAVGAVERREPDVALQRAVEEARSVGERHGRLQRGQRRAVSHRSRLATTSIAASAAVRRSTSSPIVICGSPPRR